MSVQTPSETIACVNTDREIWREPRADGNGDRIFVTEGGWIGINCGGRVIVTTVGSWFRAHDQFADMLAALTALRDAVKEASAMQGREYVGLGIQVNDAIAKAEGR